MVMLFGDWDLNRLEDCTMKASCLVLPNARREAAGEGEIRVKKHCTAFGDGLGWK